MTTVVDNTAYFTRATSLDSSVLSDAFYDDNTGNLFVRLGSGRTVGYRDVEPEAYEGLTQTGSPGRYWNWYIKGQYTGLSGDVTLVPRVEDEPLNKVEVPTSLPADEPIVANGNYTIRATEPQTVRAYFVTVAVQASSVSRAVAEVSASGLDVVSVNLA